VAAPVAAALAERTAAALAVLDLTVLLAGGHLLAISSIDRLTPLLALPHLAEPADVLPELARAGWLGGCVELTALAVAVALWVAVRWWRRGLAPR
jgi:hypothetical protein